MKKILPLLALFGVLNNAFAVFPFYDPFDNATASGGSSYAVGSALKGQTNSTGDVWFGVSTTANANNPILVTNTPLTYSGLPSAGNSVRLSSPNSGPGGRMFNSTNIANSISVNEPATVYYSLLLRVLDLGTLSTSGDYFAGFNNQGTYGDQTAQPAAQGARLYLRKVVDGGVEKYQVGTSKNSTVVAYDQNDLFTTNDTVLIVQLYEIRNTSSTDDDARLWVNPGSATFGAYVPPQDTTNILGVEADLPTRLSSFVLMNRTATIPTSFLVDELRVGRTWTFVTGGPEITVAPIASTNINYGDALKLTVEAKSGSTALSYRWRQNGVNLVDGPNVSGSTTPSLTISNTTVAGDYSVVVNNSVGAVTNVTTVTLVDPYITQQPLNQVVAPGSTAHFTIKAVGTAPLTYRWRKDTSDLSDGGKISGATTTNLAIANVSSADIASYSCIVSNASGNSVESTNATLALVDPGFASQPQNSTVNYGGTASFTASAVGTPPISYRWQKDGVVLANGASASGAIISGATSSNLTIVGVAYLDTGTYAVFVTNGLGTSLTSDPAVLSVNDPSITTQPVGQTNVQGTTVNLTVAANGTPPLSYAWYKDNNPLSDGGNISGSTTNHLTITSAGVSNTGDYYVIVSGGSGSNVVSATVPVRISVPLGQSLYWDSNGATPGAGDPPTGTWGTDGFWSTDSTGGATTGGWSDGSTAVFSAGADSVSAVTVTVNSTRAVTGINFEEAAVSLSSGTISMVGGNGQSTISVADGLLATFNSTVISGTNDLVKTGGGTLRLVVNNLFTGRNIIKAGAVSVQGDARFGAVPSAFQADNIILDGGTAEITATGNPGQNLPLTRGVTITTNNGTIAETASSGNGAWTMFSVISGPGKLTKIGPAIIRLENSNTYAGGTDLNEGKIYVNASGGIGSGVLTIGATAGIILRTTLATATTVTISNSIVLSSGANPVVAAGGNGTTAHFQLAGVISGPGGFTRGTNSIPVDKDVILLSANTYLGGTIVDFGRLLVNNVSGSGTGPGAVTVNATGILGGSGTIAGTVTVIGGTIAAGSSAGKLTLQSGLDMSVGGTNVWELAALKDEASGTAGTDFDQVALTGGTLNANNATLVIGYTGLASAPSSTNSFWNSPHTWTVIALSGTATNSGPSNFAGVQDATNSVGVFATEVTGNGSIRLLYTPNVTSPTIQSISVGAGNAALSWLAANGINYEVQYKTNLSQTNWIVVTNVTGSGGLISVTNSTVGDPMRFYRLAITP